jgi:plasmid stabilization system protein ParE
MRRIIYAARTRRDLEIIHAFIAEESQNQMVADHFISRLLDACETLETLPDRFAAYPYAARRPFSG